MLVSPRPARSSSRIAPLLLGVVLGASLQLQQPRLSSLGTYVALGVVALAVLAVAGARRPTTAVRWCALLAASAALSAGVAGWRAASYLQHGLDPRLEGRDLLVTGI